MEVQWYPGHMTKARRMMQEEISLIDILIELVDARCPESSRNPDIDALGKGKKRLIVMTKADLAGEKACEAWKAWYKEQGFAVCSMDLRSRAAVKGVAPLIRQVCHEKIERDRKRGILNRPIRAMVAGIPNVGKSTFINSLVGKASAKTGNKPGVTKGKQWIRLGKDIELLDTPGILWPKFDDRDAAMRLAMVGSIRDEVLQEEELALALLEALAVRAPGAAKARYGIEEDAGYAALEGIAQARGCVRSGGVLDTEKASRLLLDDFRSGRLCRVTLEMPGEGGSASSVSE